MRLVAPGVWLLCAMQLLLIGAHALNTHSQHVLSAQSQTQAQSQAQARSSAALHLTTDAALHAELQAQLQAQLQVQAQAQTQAEAQAQVQARFDLLYPCYVCVRTLNSLLTQWHGWLSTTPPTPIPVKPQWNRTGICTPMPSTLIRPKDFGPCLRYENGVCTNRLGRAGVVAAEPRAEGEGALDNPFTRLVGERAPPNGLRSLSPSLPSPSFSPLFPAPFLLICTFFGCALCFHVLVCAVCCAVSTIVTLDRHNRSIEVPLGNDTVRNGLRPALPCPALPCVAAQEDREGKGKRKGAEKVRTCRQHLIFFLSLF
jgi:hypothetical protein